MALLDVSGKVVLLGVHLVTMLASKHQLLVSSSHVTASALRVAKGGRAFEAREVFVAVRVLHVISKILLFPHRAWATHTFNGFFSLGWATVTFFLARETVRTVFCCPKEVVSVAQKKTGWRCCECPASVGC